MKELEKAIVNLVRAENSDIKQKQDQARLHIHHCQLVLVNTYSQTANSPTEVKDSPLTQVTACSSILKNVCFSGKDRQSLHINLKVMRICKMLIYCVKLDHALYLINYGNTNNIIICSMYLASKWIFCSFFFPFDHFIINYFCY